MVVEIRQDPALKPAHHAHHVRSALVDDGGKELPLACRDQPWHRKVGNGGGQMLEERVLPEDIGRVRLRAGDSYEVARTVVAGDPDVLVDLPSQGVLDISLESEGLPQHVIEERARQVAGGTGEGRSVLAGGGH